MSIKTSALIQFGLFLISLGYSLTMSGKMTEIVPTHWNAAGQIDGSGSKWISLLLMPVFILFIAAMTLAVPKLSPEKFEIKPFESTYSLIMLIVNGLMVAMHFVIVNMSAGAKWDIGQVMMGILFGSFILIGNFMGKVQPNFYMGVRTPWTLSDERVWHGTHRFAAKLFFFGSIPGLIFVLIGLPFWLTFSYFMLISMLPIVQSFFLYRALHRTRL